MHGALRAVQSVALGGDLGHNALDEVLLALAGNGQTQTLADLQGDGAEFCVRAGGGGSEGGGRAVGGIPPPRRPWVVRGHQTNFLA